ncbi:MAG: NAD(P)/FAD-dependent oxidoreductase [Tepidiformaceae bacterium]
MDDVVVVGASLAGVSTAIHLRRLGHRVTLLDRATVPRRKPCGEGLFPLGVRALRELGDFEALIASARPLHGVRFNAGGSISTASLGGQPGLGIRREPLGSALLTAATDAGVVIRTGTMVTALRLRSGRVEAVDTSAGPVAARAFVAADGLQSSLRRMAGLDGPLGSRYGVTAHVVLQRELEPLVDIFFERGFELYVTPVGGRSANAALLLRRAAMTPFAGRVREAFIDLLTAHPSFTAGFELEDAPIVAGPFQRRCTRAWRANLVLAGDAAGFFDGISGEGMSAALCSGPLAAQAVHDYLATGSYAPFRAYDRARQALARNSDLLARVSLALSRNHVVARRAVSNLARQPETFTRLVAVSNGAAPLRSLRPRDLLALTTGL